MTTPHSSLGIVSKSALVLALAYGATGLGAAAGDSLTFDPTHYTEQAVKVGDQTIAYRAYEGIVYVAHPVDAEYQSLNFYVPAAYYEGKSIGGYTAETAPIFFPNSVGGYMPGRPGSPVNTGGPGMPLNGPRPPTALAGPGGTDQPPAGPMPAGAPGPDGSKRVNTIAAALAHGYVVAAPGGPDRVPG